MIHYRYRTFAERLGPSNARSIVFHYIGVMVMVYFILTVRGYVLEISDNCDRINDPLERNVNPTSASYGYWSSIICSISTSTYMMAAILRKYLDFTSYYISIGVAIVNTVIMLVLSKHLWRAYWIKSPHKQNAQNQASKDSSAAGKIDNSDSVSIDMECSGGNLVCVDDNFCIEVILAAFDFFRVSETKVD